MDQGLVNRFIIFYTLKYVWKQKQDRVSTMHEALGTNRTMVDNIIALKEVELIQNQRAMAFQKLTDIDAGYWDGEKQLIVPGIQKTEWVKFIELKQNRNLNDRTQESEARRSIESKIENAIKMERSQMSGALVKLIFFAENKRKQSTLDVENNIQVIRRMMAANQWRELAKLDKDRLEEYRVALKEQYELVSAVSVIMRQERG